MRALTKNKKSHLIFSSIAALDKYPKNNFSFKTIKVFSYVFLTLVLSEILMRYIETSQLLFLFVIILPIIIYFLVYKFLISKVNYG